MGYLWNHTALYDGHFNILHFIIILISLAVIGYCAYKLRALNKKKKELEKAAEATASADAVLDNDK